MTQVSQPKDFTGRPPRPKGVAILSVEEPVSSSRSQNRAQLETDATMFAIIRDGGKQYRVEEGMSLYLDRRDCAAGDKLELNEVLSIEDGSDFQTGAPLIDGAKVVAEVVGEAKGPKLIFHRFRRRKGSRSRSGHRQKYTQVRIESIHS